MPISCYSGELLLHGFWTSIFIRLGDNNLHIWKWL